MTEIPVVTHPTWCDPRYCDAIGPEDVRHRSAPISQRLAGDDDVERLVYRYQHVGDTGGTATYQMRICHLGYPDEEMTLLFTKSDVTSLVEALDQLDALG